MREYDQNIAIVKQYRDSLYRVTWFRSLRKPADEADSSCNSKKEHFALWPTEKVTGRHDEKLLSSLARSRSAVFQLAICNDWEYFVTMTIDGAKHDRRDLKAFQRRLAKWVNNYNTNKQTAIKYLFIPELHRDKVNWHIHGLLMGIPETHLTAFTLQDKLPQKMRKLLREEGRELYNWPAYADAFGWVSMETIRDPIAVAHYISKYISKRLGTNIALNDHVYYCSKGLNRAEVIHRGDLRQDFDPDYITEHIAIKTVRSVEEAMWYFTDTIE